MGSATTERSFSECYCGPLCWSWQYFGVSVSTFQAAVRSLSASLRRQQSQGQGWRAAGSEGKGLGFGVLGLESKKLTKPRNQPCKGDLTC